MIGIIDSVFYIVFMLGWIEMMDIFNIRSDSVSIGVFLLGILIASFITIFIDIRFNEREMRKLERKERKIEKKREYIDITGVDKNTKYVISKLLKDSKEKGGEGK